MKEQNAPRAPFRARFGRTTSRRRTERYGTLYLVGDRSAARLRGRCARADAAGRLCGRGSGGERRGRRGFPACRALWKSVGPGVGAFSALWEHDSKKESVSSARVVVRAGVAARSALEDVGRREPRQVCQYVFKRNDIVWICRTCQADETCVMRGSRRFLSRRRSMCARGIARGDDARGRVGLLLGTQKPKQRSLSLSLGGGAPKKNQTRRLFSCFFAERRRGLSTAFRPLLSLSLSLSLSSK